MHIFRSMLLCYHCTYSLYAFSLSSRRIRQSTFVRSRFQALSVLADNHQSTAAVETNTDVLHEIPIDDDSWKAYVAAMEQMVTRPGVVKKAKPHEVAKCREFLLSRSGLAPISILPQPSISSELGAAVAVADSTARSKAEVGFETFCEALEEQNSLFQQHYNFTQREQGFISRCLVYVGDFCAKPRQQQEDGFNRQAPILVSWHKLKEMGNLPRENSLSTYMYILSTAADDDNDGSASLYAGARSSPADDVLLEIVTCHRWLYGSNEKTVVIQLKNLIRRGDVAMAEKLLTSLETEAQQPQQSEDAESQDLGLRLRTFLPLLEHYCERGDADAILRLYRRMQEAPGTHLDDSAYVTILSSLARHGYFREKQEYSNTPYGPKLFEILASTMANDVLEVTPETAIILEEGFRADSGAAVAEHVTIPSNCTCPSTGAKLRLLKLGDNQRQHVHDNLLEMAQLSSQEFVQKVNEISKKNGQPETISTTDNHQSAKEHAYHALLNFSEWLDLREGKPFTTIVDGANVAYYGHSHVHYSSLKTVVEKLVTMGENPLVVMPSKYVQRSFRVGRYHQYQTLSKQDLGVIEWLQENEMMYVVPRLCLDDYFWMLASVSNQTRSREGVDMTVPVGDELGRFPGMRPMIITNDQMRDHKLSLLEPREFRRWCNCHIVNYHLGFYEADEWASDRSVRLEPADYFSREIQGNPHPSGIGNVWHFPISNSTEWFYIWLGSD